jgi:phage gp46-like protein
MATYGQNAEQIGDILMIHQSDCGDIVEQGGIITMTKFFETMVYLILFGSNEDDDGSESTSKNQWWGNEGEPEEEQYRGRFHYLTNTGRPITSAFLIEVRDAAVEDLEKGLVIPGYADSVSVSVFASGPKRMDVSIRIVFNGNHEYRNNYEVAA